MWCLGPVEQADFPAAFGLPPECGATVLVTGEVDLAVHTALRELGWWQEAGKGWRCPRHT